MARRNLFLVVSLLVMVGVLIAAVLWGGEGEGSSRPGGGFFSSAASGDGDEPGGTGEVRTGAAEAGGGDDAEAGRREVETFEIPLAGSEPVAQVRVRGRLVDAEGAGVADVELSYRGGIVEGDFLPRFRGLGEGGPSVRTDADGGFGFDVPGDGRAAEITLARAAHRLFAESDRRARRIAKVEGDVDLGDLATTTAASVVGQVVDDAGQPVTDASVRVRRLAAWIGGGDDQEVDAEGRFEVRGLESGTHWVSVAARGYVPPKPVEVQLEAGSTSEEVLLTVTTGASIAGTVLDDNGQPIEGARVVPFRRRESTPGVQISSFDSDEAVETDRNGYFVLSGLEGDRVSLRATHEGHAPALSSNIAVGTGRAEIRLDRLGSVQGSLSDPAGNALVGSRVMVRSGGDAMVTAAPEGAALMAGSASAVTDEEGRFEIEGVRPGNVQLTAEGDGHLPIEGRPLQLRPGGRIANLRLIAETGAGISAIVVDPSGAPLAGAEVLVRPQPREPAVGGAAGPGGRSVRIRASSSPGGGSGPVLLDEPGELGSATTGEDGTARIGGLPAGTVEVVASHPDWAPPRPVATTLNRSGFVETILSMRPAGSALVKVVDGGGEVVEGVPIKLQSQGSEATVLRARSDERGFARFEPLLTGAWEAVLELPPRARTIAPGMSFSLAGAEGQALPETVRKFEVVAGETTELDLVQPVLTRIHGTVTDASGLAEGVRVQLRLADAPPFGSSWETTTDAAGNYELNDVPAGAYAIEWSRTDDALPHADTLDVQSGTPEILRDLVLGGGGVRVLVTSAADGTPVAGARVTIERPGAPGRPQVRAVMMVATDTGDGGGTTTMTVGGEGNEATTDAQGIAELSGIPPGTFELVVRHADHTTLRQSDVTVVDGQVGDQAVQVRPAGTVAGGLLGFPAASPAQVAMVEIRLVDGDDEPRTEVVQGSSYRVGGLEPGDYLVRARSLLGQSEFGPEQRVTVVAGETASVDLSVQQ